MDINVFSFFMAVVWSSSAILALYFGRKRRNFIWNFGISSLMIIYAVCAIRLLFPLEFPFVQVINVTGIFAGVYEVTCLDKIQIFGITTTIAYVLLAVWIFIAFLFTIRWIVQYRRTIWHMNMRKECRDLEAERILDQIKPLCARNLSVQVWRTPQTEIPMGVGILHRMILLPKDGYTEQELYYILQHEYTHFVNRDIEIKILSHMFCCIFWWNPVVYLLKKDLDQTLEIKCDLTVTRIMDKRQTASYLATIVEVIKKAGEKQGKKQEVDSAMLFQPKMDAAVIERFQVVMDEYKRNRTKTGLYYGCIVLLCSVMAFSYLFQVQAAFPPPPLEEGEEMTPENTYLLDNGDGTYTVIDVTGNSKDSILEEQWLIDDMIQQGFPVRKEREKE